MPRGFPGTTTHGLRATYTSGGCRCDLCREAHTSQLRLDRKARYEATERGEMPAHIPHGRASTYANWGCHCQPCLDAHTVKMREDRQRAEARGKPFPSLSPERRRERERAYRARKRARSAVSAI